MMLVVVMLCPLTITAEMKGHFMDEFYSLHCPVHRMKLHHTTPHHTKHTQCHFYHAYHLLSAVTGKCTLRVHLHVTHSFTAV